MRKRKSGSKSVAIKLWSILGAFLILSLTIYIVQTVSLKTIEKDGLEINLAGAQRMLSQRTTKDALDYYQSKNSNSLLSLKQGIERFETVLHGLRRGDATLGLPGFTDPTLISQLDRVEKIWQQLKPALLELTSPNIQGVSALDQIRTLSSTVLNEMNEVVTMLEANSAQKVRTMKRIQLILFAIALVLVAVSVLFGNATVVKPTEQIQSIVDKIYAGNQDLQKHMGQAQSQLDFVSDVAGNSTKTAHNISDAIADVAQELQSLSARSDELAQSTTDSMKQMNMAAEEIRKGATTLKESQSAANLLEGNIYETGNALKELLAKIKSINEFTTQIEAISEQTNLLALNATIEAARAGEHGRGFAVVAEEVRKLADNSAHASESISQLAREIEMAGRHTADVMENSQSVIEQVREGNSDFDAVFTEIRKISGSVVQTIKQVNSHVFDQTASFEEVSAAAEQITASAHETATMAASSEKAVKDLQHMIKEVVKGNNELVKSVEMM